AEQVVISGEVLELFRKSAHALELTLRRREAVLLLGHHLGNFDDHLLLKVENEIDNLSVCAMLRFHCLRLRYDSREEESQRHNHPLHLFHINAPLKSLKIA